MADELEDGAELVQRYWAEGAPTFTPVEWEAVRARVGTRKAAAPDGLPPGAAAECELWGGHVTPAGYGRLNVQRPGGGRGTAFAHVLAVLVSGRTREGGAEVRHLCNRRNCVEPTHLALGSRLDNEADKRVGTRIKPPCVAVDSTGRPRGVVRVRRGLFAQLEDLSWIPEEELRLP